MVKNRETVVVNLPFEGFYHSLYSDAVDHEEEQFVEWRADETGNKGDLDYEMEWPEALRVDGQELASILFDVTDYRAAYDQIARDYVSAFDCVAGDDLGMTAADTQQRYNYETKEMETEAYRRPSIHMTFESMDSPREYNFATDRVYGTLPLAVMYLMFRKSRANGHAALKATIEERFTSYDGFRSHYSNELADWLEKPLRDYDHNELGTLLIAAMRLASNETDDEMRWRLYEATCGDCGAYQAWESAVDWQKFDAKRMEKRAEKLADWIEEDDESALIWRAHHMAEWSQIVAADESLFTGFDETEKLPYRCPETHDFFA